MKKKHMIGRLLAIAVAIFLITHTAATAADKVVVIPLGSSRDIGAVPTVTSAGQVWMDRNLGALGVATKSDDPKAYGSLYQWGRLGDGHEYRESPVTDTLSPTYVPGHGNFITVNASPWDWRTGQNPNLWQGEAGINNPCPAGFRLPMRTEWQDEIDSWGSKNAAGAFGSPLRLIKAGYRNHNSGTLGQIAVLGLYWSSTVNGIYPRYLNFSSSYAGVDVNYRTSGFSVRCIKD